MKKYDVLIWSEEAKAYTGVAGPIEGLEETKKAQQIWWKEYNEISIIHPCDTGIGNAIIRKYGKIHN